MTKEEILQQAKTTDNQETIQNMLDFKNNDILLVLFSNKNITAEQRKYIIDNANFTDYKIDDILDELAESKLNKNRRLVAKNQYCTAELLTKLADDEDATVRSNVIKNKLCPVSVIIKSICNDSLVYDQYTAIDQLSRYELTENQFSQLVKVDNAVLKNVLAKHKNCPISILPDLANDESSLVRVAVAKHKLCPSDILAKLADDSAYTVIEAAIKNKNCPTDSLIQVAIKVNSYTIGPILARRDLTDEQIKQLIELDNDMLLRYIVRNKQFPIDSLIELAKHSYYCDILEQRLSKTDLTESQCKKLFAHNSIYTASLLAQYDKCPAEILIKLADDEIVNIRKYVAKNPNCPTDVLVKLSDDSDEDVLRAVVTNKKCPEAIVNKLVTRINKNSTNMQQLNINVADKDSFTAFIDQLTEHVGKPTFCRSIIAFANDLDDLDEIVEFGDEIITDPYEYADDFWDDDVDNRYMDNNDKYSVYDAYTAAADTCSKSDIGYYSYSRLKKLEFEIVPIMAKDIFESCAEYFYTKINNKSVVSVIIANMFDTLADLKDFCDKCQFMS